MPARAGRCSGSGLPATAGKQAPCSAGRLFPGRKRSGTVVAAEAERGAVREATARSEIFKSWWLRSPAAARTDPSARGSTE
jgi:hypothetical protein